MASAARPNLRRWPFPCSQFPAEHHPAEALEKRSVAWSPAWCLPGQGSRLSCRLADPPKNVFRGLFAEFRRGLQQAPQPPLGRQPISQARRWLEAWPKAWLQRSSQSSAPSPAQMRSTHPLPFCGDEARPRRLALRVRTPPASRLTRPAARNWWARSSPRSSSPSWRSGRSRCGGSGKELLQLQAPSAAG